MLFFEVGVTKMKSGMFHCPQGAFTQATWEHTSYLTIFWREKVENSVNGTLKLLLGEVLYQKQLRNLIFLGPFQNFVVEVYQLEHSTCISSLISN